MWSAITLKVLGSFGMMKKKNKIEERFGGDENGLGP